MPIIQAGTTNLTGLVVPDLYVQIVPPQQLTLNGVPSNLAAFVGTASWGPLNTPLTGSSYEQFVANFGNLNNRKYDMGTHVAVGILQGMNNFVGVRVSDGTDVAATAAIASNLTFNALWTGTQGNNINVTVNTGSKLNTFKFIVTVPGFVAEVFDNVGYTSAVATTTVTSAVTSSATIPVASTAGIAVGDVISGTGVTGSPTVSAIGSLQVTASASQTISNSTTLTFTPPYSQVWANAATAINNGTAGQPASHWITATAGAGTTAPSVGTTYTLTGGTDGVGTVTAATVIGAAPSTGMYALSGSGFSILDVVDCDTATQWTTIDSFAVQESGYAIVSSAAGSTVSQSVTAKQTAGVDSWHTKVLHGDALYWADPVNQITRLVSPVAFAVGRLANLSPQYTGLNKTIYGIAGSQKTGLVGASALSSYSQGDLNTLVTAGIDVICNPGGAGIRVWTLRFGHNSSSNQTLHGDNYTLLTNYIAKTLNAGMGNYLGRTANLQLFNDITGTLTLYASTLAGNGLIGKSDNSRPFTVICNSSNNPVAQIKQGVVQADIAMSYLGIVEKFICNLQNGTEIAVSTSTVSNSQ